MTSFEATVPLNRPWLRGSRAAWAAVALTTLALVVAGLPRLLAELSATADPRAVQDLDMTLSGYATYLTGLNMLVVLAHFIIAGLIFRRRSDEWLALFVAFALVTNGSLIPLSLTYPLGETPILAMSLVEIVTSIGLTTGVILLFVFPDGRFVPGWTRLMAAGWALLVLAAVFLPESSLSLPNWPLGVQVLVLLVWTGTGVASQIYRYVHVSSNVQRQQTKWAILGLILAVAGPFGYFLPHLVLPFIHVPEIPNILYQRVGPSLFTFTLAFQLGGWTVFTLILLIFPVSLVIAIMRYRLWDIDVIINRTLVYATLTGSLALVYLLGVVVLQRLFPVESQIAVVASTLAIAALFSPLRQRIQRGIDRRFYRRKYDTEQIMAAFSASMREEVDLDALSQTLLAVVGETMQPAHVSLWLKQRQEHASAPSGRTGARQ